MWPDRDPKRHRWVCFEPIYHQKPRSERSSTPFQTVSWRSSEKTPSTHGEGLPRVAHGPGGPTTHEVGYWARLAKRQHETG